MSWLIWDCSKSTKNSGNNGVLFLRGTFEIFFIRYPTSDESYGYKLMASAERWIFLMTTINGLFYFDW